MNINIKKITLQAYVFTTTFWGGLLFITQKSFFILGYLGIKYKINTLISIYITMLLGLLGFSLIILSNNNEYSNQHLLGFGLFLISIPVINNLVRYHRKETLKWLSYVLILNSIMIFSVYVFGINLQQYRGLNTIFDKNNNLTRIFFESACLYAAYNFNLTASKKLNYALFAINFLVVVFAIKSILITILLILKNLNPVFKNKIKDKSRFGIIFFLVLIVVAVFISLTVRPDLFLSIATKYMQLELLTFEKVSAFGQGWGYYITGLSSDLDQPYQIEMQLPMLFVQTGYVFILFFIIIIFCNIKNSKVDHPYFSLFLYLSVGFSNPWLFLPSWYILCLLIGSKFDEN